MAFFSLELAVLRDAPEDNSRPDLGVRADLNVGLDDDVRMNLDRVREPDSFSEDGVGADFYVLADLHAGMDDCGGMNL